MNPNVRVFDCGGVLVKFEIADDGWVGVTICEGREEEDYILNPYYRRIINKLFPNGYATDPEPETAKEVVK